MIWSKQHNSYGPFPGKCIPLKKCNDSPILKFDNVSYFSPLCSLTPPIILFPLFRTPAPSYLSVYRTNNCSVRASACVLRPFSASDRTLRFTVRHRCILISNPLLFSPLSLMMMWHASTLGVRLGRLDVVIRLMVQWMVMLVTSVLTRFTTCCFPSRRDSGTSLIAPPVEMHFPQRVLCLMRHKSMSLLSMCQLSPMSLLLNIFTSALGNISYTL